MTVPKSKNSSLDAQPHLFLESSGWRRSFLEQEAVDNEGPVPWFTYPALRFLKNIIRPNFKVLEFGSGNSSIWWSAHVRQVVSVEHDPQFASALTSKDIPNVTVLERIIDAPLHDCHRQLLYTDYFPLGKGGRKSDDPTRNYRAGLLDHHYMAYAAVGLTYPKGYFDVIVIDGMARVLTSWVASRQVGANGIVVFDNSDRAEYEDGYQFLLDAGFARIDFWGLGPINPYEWCTSIFFKDLSALTASFEPPEGLYLP